MNKTSTRLNKYISESGICSRREADRYIEKGNVLINGKRAKIGDPVFKGDRVMVNGNMIEPKKDDESILIAFNKPVGVTSTTDLNTTDNIVRYVNHSERIFPIGRLDKDSQGLIFLTSNGDIVNKILRAGNQHEKEYLVTVNKPITDEFIASMAAGVPVLGGTTKKCFVKKETPFIFRIILIQGMNRQIRRMCEYFNYDVTKLERIRIMNVNIKGLPVGEWRELTPDEQAGINKMIENSSSTDNRQSQKSKGPKSNNSRNKKAVSVESDFVKTDWSSGKKAKQHSGNKLSHPPKKKSKTFSSGKNSGQVSGRNSGRRGRSR